MKVELTQQELRELIILLEWVLEGNTKDDDVKIGETDSKTIFPILKKLKVRITEDEK